MNDFINDIPYFHQKGTRPTLFNLNTLFPHCLQVVDIIDCSTQNKSVIGMVIIDNIASLFFVLGPSFCYSSHSNPMFTWDRTGNLFFVSSQLRKLEELHHVPVSVTNQVSIATCSLLSHWCHMSSD